MFKSIVGDSRNGRGGKLSGCPTDGFSMALDSANGELKALRITIGDGLMKACRWQVGDRINVMLDIPSRIGLLERNSKHGWTITTNGSKSVKRAVLKGIPPDRSVIHAMFPNGSRHYTPESVRIDDQGVLFDLPSQPTGAKP